MAWMLFKPRLGGDKTKTKRVMNAALVTCLLLCTAANLSAFINDAACIRKVLSSMEPAEPSIEPNVALSQVALFLSVQFRAHVAHSATDLGAFRRC